ncbi:MAG: Rhs family protein [uncultured Cytophagales bacterium]|uniref:Rhs family protein n=1 Tax=uncultured Cytophagales bacterium TaxID=158755 RepID=A0A6J4HN13_9SPHI|nr:MAG: Rhs family protein [uncultured Cytophagales bacterium]
MNPAAKQFDIVMGVDIHLIQLPAPGPPVPIPHPFIGMVFDPMDFVPLLGATILVNGVPRAQAGTGAKDIPVHFPLGGTFIKPPGNEGEMFMGSTTVLAEDEPFTYMSLPVLSCHDIGMPPPPRPKNTDGSKTMMLPTSLVLPIPMGRPVLVGGPPTISLTGLAMKLGLAGLGKGLKKFREFQKGSDRMAGLSKKLRGLVDKTPLSPGAKDRLKSVVCTLTGHPVNVADGTVLTSVVDFELPGPIPLRWERFWFSDSTYGGPLGHGWFHPYDLALEVHPPEGAVVARLPEGRLAAFPLPEAGGRFFDRKEKLTLFNDGTGLCLRDGDLLTYRFRPDGVAAGATTVHALESIEDANGYAIRFSYGRGNVLSGITDSAGRELRVIPDERGRIAQIQAPHPELAGEWIVLQAYRYDEWGNLVEAADALGQPATYAYQGHLLTRETNRNGLSFYFQYHGDDEKARCFRTWGDGGIYDHKLRYYDGFTVVENSLGHRTTYSHEGGLVLKTVDPNGGVTLTTYNEYNELLSEKDPLGFGPAYEYDDRGNPVLTIAPDGATTQVSFNDLDLPVRAVDPVGGAWAWQYDEKGNLTERTDPLGRQTAYRYQGGLPVEITNPAGGKTVLGYDAQRNLKMLVTPDGLVSWWRYDALGRCTEAVDPKGNAQRRKFDGLGRVTEVQEPDGNVRRLRYDGEGNVIRATDAHHDVRFEYAGMDRLKARTEHGTRVEFRYDAEERLTGIVNEHGFAYRFALDANGEVVEEQGFDGLRRVYLRDAAGRVTQVQRPGGLTSRYAHDPAGRVLQIRHSDGTEERFAYREDGELTEAANAHLTVTLERDLLGRVVGERQGDVAVESAYDPLGLRTSVRSSLGADFGFVRNLMGDVSRVSAGAWGVGFRRDDLGRELEREFSGGLRSRWSRDRLGRPVKQETFTGGGFRERTRTYGWGLDDRLQQIDDSSRGLTRFGHDPLGNLAWSENPDGSVLYRMPDAVGNLFRTKERSDRKYGPAGQLLQAGGTRYDYDEEGNLVRKTEGNGKVWHYAWNAAGMLGRVVRPDGEAVSFTYDALGRRLSKTFRGRTTRWVWDGNTPLHEWTETPNLMGQQARQGAAGAATNGGSVPDGDLVTWLFEPESFAPLAKLVGGRSYGIVTDHLGTPLSMHGDTGEAVWSADLNCYGQVLNLRGKAEDCPFRYPGQYEDVETGLYYNRFRYYDAKEGMYVSQDPIRLVGGVRFYAFVNNPLVAVKNDAEGHVSIRPKNDPGDIKLKEWASKRGQPNDLTDQVKEAVVGKTKCP